jgi:hypothetical protein
LVYFDACVAASKGIMLTPIFLGAHPTRSCTEENKHMSEGQPTGCEYDFYGNTPVCPFWDCVTWATWAEAHENNKSAILQKRVAPPDCSWRACDPVSFTILNFTDPRWNWERPVIGICVDGLWHDPRAKLVFQNIVVLCKTTSSQIPITRNLFLSLAETRAQSLNVTSYYVWGRRSMTLGDQSIRSPKPRNGTGCPHLKAGTWLLETSIIGKKKKKLSCLVGREGQQP